MVENAGSSVIQLGLAFSKQYSTMAEADPIAIRMCGFAKNVSYALLEAQEQGAFESPPEGFHRNLEVTHGLLKQLEAWTADYINAGKNKGRLVRLCDCFYAGATLDVLKKTSEDLDQAVKAMGLAVKMETSAGVKDMIEQQNSIATDVVEALKQHAGRPDESLLAAKVAKMTNIAAADVQRELTACMEALRRVENRSQYIRDEIVHDLERKMGSMRIVARADPAEDLAGCLEMAPFSRLEWVNEFQGRRIDNYFN
jgi:hypothetical protein